MAGTSNKCASCGWVGIAAIPNSTGLCTPCQADFERQQEGLALIDALPESQYEREEEAEPKGHWEKDPTCLAEWPEAESGEYNPLCCRFPKSCSVARFVLDAASEQGSAS